MANKTDGLIEQRVTPNVVPATFSPDPVSFEPKTSAELRSKQAKFVRDYATQQITVLERNVQRNWREVNGERVWMDEQELAEVKDLAYTYKVAQTLMAESIADFAGAMSLETLEAHMPEIFGRYVDHVLRDRYPERYEPKDVAPPAEELTNPALPEETPAEAEELEVISPPVPVKTIDEALGGIEDVSPLSLPDEDQMTTADVLGKISEDNAND